MANQKGQSHIHWPVELAIAAFMTAVNVGATLRFWFEWSFRNFFFEPLSPYIVNWTPGYCFLIVVLATPLALSAVNEISCTRKDLRHGLIGLNVICFTSAMSPLIVAFFRDLKLFH